MSFKLWLESSTRQPWVYHVTYYCNLDLISDEGLDYKEYGGSNFPSDVLQQHSSQGNFFCTDPSHIDWWVHVLEYQAKDKWDTDVAWDEQGLVPIVLRFRLNPKKHIPDPKRETPSDHLTEKIIPPQGLQVWDGKKWWPIAYWSNVNPNVFLDRDENGVDIKQHYPLPQL